jgi:hypothetical protein
MEKVITEWKIVETDDGFRIEVKGDKEHLREWVNTIGAHGPLRRARRWMRFGSGGPGCGHFSSWDWPQGEPPAQQGQQ